MKLMALALRARGCILFMEKTIMAKDERGAAASKLLQMIQSKKTGDAPAKPAGVRPITSSPTAAKKAAPVKVVLHKAAASVRGEALVVDGSPRMAMTLQNALKGMKFRAETATTGAEALKMMQQTPYDLLILDLQLPDISGFNLCSKMRALAGDRPVVVIMTGEDRSPGMRDQALMVDANEYMPKPVNMGELGQILDLLLKQRYAEPSDGESGNRLPPGGL